MKSKDYIISPPAKDSGKEPLFRVVYAIDVNAPNALQAAKLAHQRMKDPDAILPVLEVMDYKGNVVTIDLGGRK